MTLEALQRIHTTAKHDKERAQVDINECKRQIIELEKQIMLLTGKRDHASDMMDDIKREIDHLDA